MSDTSKITDIIFSKSTLEDSIFGTCCNLNTQLIIVNDRKVTSGNMVKWIVHIA